MLLSLNKQYIGSGAEYFLLSFRIFYLKKSEIHISGIATFRRHSPTQSRRREEDRAWFIKRPL
jgi:hypothetical protein